MLQRCAREDYINIDWLQVSSSLLSNKSRGLTTEWSNLILSLVSFDRTIWAFQKLRIFNLQERNLMIAGMMSFCKLKFLHAISLWMPPAAVIAAKELESIQLMWSKRRRWGTAGQQRQAPIHGRVTPTDELWRILCLLEGRREKTPHRVSTQSGNAPMIFMLCYACTTWLWLLRLNR